MVAVGHLTISDPGIEEMKHPFHPQLRAREISCSVMSRIAISGSRSKSVKMMDENDPDGSTSIYIHPPVHSILCSKNKHSDSFRP